jgi:hypothetical protein
VRGEAALVVALLRRVEDYQALRTIANDPEKPARLRGLLALGRHGGGGAESLLGSVVRNTEDEDERVVAAHALALLDPKTAHAEIFDLVQRHRGGSYRRHRDLFLALLAGFVRNPDPASAGMLRALLFDASNHDPLLQSLTLEALARIEGSLNAEEIARLLRRGSDEQRAGTLAWLRRRVEKPDDELCKRVGQLAERDRAATVRAAALRCLTEWRSLRALEIAGKALASESREELAAAAAAALQLGGGGMRRAIEDRILSGTLGHEALGTLLAAISSSRSEEFLDACLALATDARVALDARLQAAAVAARSGDLRAQAPLRSLLAASVDTRLVTVAAHGLVALASAHPDKPQPPLAARFYPPAATEDLRLLGPRLEGLLRAGHPEAEPLLARLFGEAHLAPGTLATALRALRTSAEAAPPPCLAQLPDSLRLLLD